MDVRMNQDTIATPQQMAERKALKSLTDNAEELYDIIREDFEKYFLSLPEDSPEFEFIAYFLSEISEEEKTKGLNPPLIYATADKDIYTKDFKLISKGTYLRLVMLTPLGEAGITTKLTGRVKGYMGRVSMKSLIDFRRTPSDK